LSWTSFDAICKDNRLNIKNEKVLVGLLEKFLDHRKDLPTPEEDDPSKKTEHLTEKEREERAKVAEEEKKAKDAEEEAKTKEEETARNALSEEEKVNWDHRKIIEKLHK